MGEPHAILLTAPRLRTETEVECDRCGGSGVEDREECPLCCGFGAVADYSAPTAADLLTDPRVRALRDALSAVMHDLYIHAPERHYDAAVAALAPFDSARVGRCPSCGVGTCPTCEDCGKVGGCPTCGTVPW